MGRIRCFAVLAPLLAAVLSPVFLPGNAGAQIVINELIPNPNGTETGADELLEIYNAGVAAVDMTGWAIEDAATIDDGTIRARIPEDFVGCPGTAVIQPGEFRVIRGQAAQAYLNNGGDTVYLVSGRTLGSPVVHTISYPDAAAQSGNVWSAIPNGSANFAWRSPSTFCASNGGAGDVTAPGTVLDLMAIAGGFPGEVRLTWTAPGDDGASGTASEYVIRVAYSPITAGTFAAAADADRWLVEHLPSAGGTPETLFVFGMDPDSTYYFALQTRDEVPNTSGTSNSSGTQPAQGSPLSTNLGYSAYFGNLHSHTNYSDGVQTPADAWFYARNTAPTPLDFLAVTEHNHSSAGMSLPSYALGMLQADAANDDGEFVAIFGQEWGIAAEGHVIILESPVLFGWESGNYDVFVAQGDYAGLYAAIQANPPDDYLPVAHFCHPASGDFSDLATTPAGLGVVHQMALVNGPANSTSTTESDVGNTNFDGEFQEALREGFRVSPTADQDNHNANWGSSSQSRTAVLSTALTKNQIMGALAAGRNYATQDHNAVVDFSANGRAMGQAFQAGTGIRLALQVTDPDVGEAVAEIELFRGITGVSDAVKVAGSLNNSHFEWRERQVFADGTEVHYYLRIRTDDNERIWTGPVYVTYDASVTTAVDEEPGAPVLDLAVGPNPTRGDLTAQLSLPSAEHATLAVYDLSGRRAYTMLDRTLEAGTHCVSWDGRLSDGSLAPTGIYFLRAKAGRSVANAKVLMVR